MIKKPRCHECGAPLTAAEIDVCDDCAAALASEQDTEEVKVTDESEDEE